MIDSHCHLDSAAYYPDRDAVIGRARAAGVRGVLVPGCEPRRWRELGPLCARDPMLSFGLGVHPYHIAALTCAALSDALAELPELLATGGARAVGECGLDRGQARRGGASLPVQREVLALQLRLAQAAGLPVVLHCVDAHGPLLELLETAGPLPRGGVLHSYSGPAELVSAYASHGLAFSFTLTVARPEAARTHRALRAVPIQRLLVESDGPDQALPKLGIPRSEPCHVRRVLDAASALRGEPFETLAAATTRNAEAIFGAWSASEATTTRTTRP